VSSLTPEHVAKQLQSVDFAAEHIVDGVHLWDNGLTISKLAYCRSPHDLRSAGIAVINVPIGGTSQQAVGSMKASGAPVVVALGGKDDWEIWRQSFSKSARLVGHGSSRELGGFLRENRSDLNPDAIYRAKLWGRSDPKSVQPELVDLSYLPLVERGLGDKVAALLENCFSSLVDELGWEIGDDMSPRNAKWLVKAPFWLLAAKVLRDKEVAGFKNIELADFSTTFGRLAKHYQSKHSERTPVSVAKYQAKALEAVAKQIDRFPSLELMSTEALGHVYESAIINKETRKRWGTHSTPVWLIDYMLGRLRPLIAEMPAERRRVFEPAVGHGGFLVGALRVLDELMPGHDRQQRKDYLRKRLSGVDIDDFSQEVARLALTLADVPNANGWDLEHADMYQGDLLERRISQSDIVLANPPYENFSAKERPKGALVNKAAEVFDQTILSIPRGGIFGFVMPQSFLTSKEGAETRRRMLNECDILEMTLFADKVFEFGQPESVVILGQKPMRKTQSRKAMTFQKVRETQVSIFKEYYEPSSSTQIDQADFLKSDQATCMQPELPNLWNRLKRNPLLQDLAHVGQGLIHKGRNDPTASKTAARISESFFQGAKEGFVGWHEKQLTHRLPLIKWLSLNKNVIRRSLSGTSVGIPQVLLNYAPVSRYEWKLKALLDPSGHPVTSRFLVVRPKENGLSIQTLWAILNSPIANAYAFGVSSKRDVTAGQMRDLPLPINLGKHATYLVDSAVDSYIQNAWRYDELKSKGLLIAGEDLFSKSSSSDHASLVDAELHLKHLHWRVDAEVLKLYDLPSGLERELLDMFTGVERRGVPFLQTEFFPPHFTDLQRLEDLLAVTGDWEKTSFRKTELIERKICKEISDSELQELDRLKMLTEARGELLAPLPLKQLDALKNRLQAKGQWEGEP
jgi:hypothetical protein